MTATTHLLKRPEIWQQDKVPICRAAEKVFGAAGHGRVPMPRATFIQDQIETNPHGRTYGKAVPVQ